MNYEGLGDGSVSKVFAIQTEGHDFQPQDVDMSSTELRTVSCLCNLSTGEVETDESLGLAEQQAWANH